MKHINRKASSLIEEDIPRGIRVAGAWSWRFILFIAALYLLIKVIVILRVVVIPVVIALLLAALFEPAARILRRWGLNRSLAAALVLIGGLIAVFGSLWIIIETFISQFSDLATQASGGIEKIRESLAEGPLHISQEQVDKGIDSLRRQVSGQHNTVTNSAVNTAITIGEIIVGFLLVIFTLFFFLRDGALIWRFLCHLLPKAARVPVLQAGHQSWETLTSYVRATVLVAFVDAVGIGIGIFILGVPLVLPLTGLVFLGSFIPIIGATVSGAVAVLVALVAQGPVTALIVLGVVLAVQQLESHILQPLIMSRAVTLHPLAVVIAITTGIVLADIVGGLVAVPILAVANTAIRYLIKYSANETTSDQPTEPSHEPHKG